MPQRAAKLCPRCRQTYRAERCPVCDERRRIARPGDRNAPRARDYGGEWARASRAYLAERRDAGLWWCACAECMARPEPMRDVATEVDHIDGLGPAGPRGFDPSNWMAMSKRHHSAKTARENGGFGNPRRDATEEPPPF